MKEIDSYMGQPITDEFDNKTPSYGDTHGEPEDMPNYDCACCEHGSDKVSIPVYAPIRLFAEDTVDRLDSFEKWTWNENISDYVTRIAKDELFLKMLATQIVVTYIFPLLHETRCLIGEKSGENKYLIDGATWDYCPNCETLYKQKEFEEIK